MKDLGILHHFLVALVVANQNTGEFWIGQPMYTECLMQRFGMENKKKKHARTSGNKAHQEDRQQQHGLPEYVLLYHFTKTFPDSAFAVRNVAHFCTEPKEHWSAVKRSFRSEEHSILVYYIVSSNQVLSSAFQKLTGVEA